jgi:hypothetical protein
MTNHEAFIEAGNAAENIGYRKALKRIERDSPSDATACSPFVVLNLKRLKLIPCADKDATQDTIRALRSNGVQCVALRWHAAAETYVQLEAHE